MRFIILILLSIGTFALYFFILSLFGLLWCNTYKEVICSGDWFGMYSLFLGWWLAGSSCYDYFKKYCNA